jgi:hypothetical protein
LLNTITEGVKVMKSFKISEASSTELLTLR